MPYSAQLAVAPLVESRTARRRVVDFSAYARETNAKVFLVDVTDISTHGCRIEGDLELEQGVTVWLKIATLNPRNAQVVWCKDREAGCEFEPPLEAAVIQELFSDGLEPALRRSKLMAARYRKATVAR